MSKGSNVLGKRQVIMFTQGDITKMQVDVIVNAANARMVPGGGVDGAINRAAGPKLAHAMGRIGKVPPGSTTVTGGYDLQAEWVVHAVGPIYEDHTPRQAQLLLEQCYKGAMDHAKRLSATTIAFPLISTGVYGYPMDEACEIAVKTINDNLYGNVIAYIVAFDDKAMHSLEKARALIA